MPPLPASLGLQRLSELEPAQRRRLWDWIQRNDSDMAQALDSQKELLALCRQDLDQGTTVVLPRSYVQRALHGAGHA